jgi:hypothetical protein
MIPHRKHLQLPEIINRPTPTLSLPLKGREIVTFFFLKGWKWLPSSPFKGEARRGMGILITDNNRIADFLLSYSLTKDPNLS